MGNSACTSSSGPNVVPGRANTGRPARVGDLGVLVGEGLPVGAHDHDVAGGGEVGLQVVDRPAGGGVGEGEVQVARAAGLGVAVELDPDAVDDHAPRALGRG